MYFQPLLNGFAMAGVLSVSSPRILRKTGRPDRAAGHRALAPLDRMTSGRADCAADVKSRIMFNPRFPGRRIAAASACAALFAVAAPAAVPTTSLDSPAPFAAPNALAKDADDEKDADAMLRDDMVRYSDNEATDALWSQYGGTKVIDSVKERYDLTDATIANPDWGSTMSSARRAAGSTRRSARPRASASAGRCAAATPDAGSAAWPVAGPCR